MTTTVTRTLTRNRAVLFGYLLVVILAVAGEIVSSGFLRINHIDELIITGGFIALVGVGQTFVILTGGVDLSIPWVLNASAVFLTLWANGDSARMAWIVPVLLVGGGVIGAINGVGVAFLRIPPIIMTLGMSSVVEGGLLLVTNGGSGQNARAPRSTSRPTAGGRSPSGRPLARRTDRGDGHPQRHAVRAAAVRHRPIRRVAAFAG